MKITEIIEDLNRLNAYLPEDPQKNYANPLERMARELMLIREFALMGDQKYVEAQLELNGPAPLPETYRRKALMKSIENAEEFANMVFEAYRNGHSPLFHVYQSLREEQERAGKTNLPSYTFIRCRFEMLRSRKGAFDSTGKDGEQ